MAARRISVCPACEATTRPHRADCLVVRATTAHREIEKAYANRGRLVREARAKGVSQGMIADALGCSKRLVQLMEKEGAK